MIAMNLKVIWEMSEDARKILDIVDKRMTLAQIAEAKRLAREWVRKHRELSKWMKKHKKQSK